MYSYFFDDNDKKHMIDEAKKKAVKSLICVFLPSPSRYNIPSDSAADAGMKIHCNAINSKTTPRTDDNKFAIFIIVLIPYFQFGYYIL